MLGSLVDFVEELRAIGVPVSMVEAIDAARALEYTDLGDREALRTTLGASLVKNERHQEAFDTAFDIFFGLAVPPAQPASEAAAEPGDAGVGGGSEDDALIAAIREALLSGDRDTLKLLARRAVDAFAGMQPGRRVGGRYYLYRVLRQLDVDGLTAEFLDAAEATEGDPLAAVLARDEAEGRIDWLRDELRREILRRLVADRGPASVAETLRAPLVEDLDLMHATRDELARIERVVAPLARKLATRLAQRRKAGHRGRLDARRTIRRSLSHGGVLLHPQLRPPRRSKPELVLLCDVSGSMATFARFTLQLTYAIAEQFSRVRSFAFIDGLVEITDIFGPGSSFADSLLEMASRPGLVWRDGHSDYGHALEVFTTEYAGAVTPRTTAIVTGDARTNYRDPRRDVLASIAGETRALFWLNPEARRYWNTGDSVMGTYEDLCDGVHEVRTLRQLERFVEWVALPHPSVRRSRAQIAG